MRRKERKQMSIADALVARRKGQNEGSCEIGRLVNWGRIDQLLNPIYAANEGRPAYGPLVMVRALLLNDGIRCRTRSWKRRLAIHSGFGALRD